MSYMFLDIVNERLELSDLDNENNKPIVFDINSDFDGSVESMATFMVAAGSTMYTVSSAIASAEDHGIDSEVLDSFLDSVESYEVA